MRHHIFTQNTSYRACVLIKAAAFRKSDLEDNYIKSLGAMGIASNEVIAMTLESSGSKVSMKQAKDYLDKLLKALESVGVIWLYVADSTYFKVLTKQAKAEPHLGYVLPCAIAGYEHMKVVLGVNHQQLIFDPRIGQKLDLTLKALAADMSGAAPVMGANIIHYSHFPKTNADIEAALQQLHKHSELACDIETFSLTLQDAGLGTIAFAWNQHEGIAFAVDYHVSYWGLSHQDPNWPGSNVRNPHVRQVLKKFFTEYKGKLTFHRGSFDIKNLIFSLFMTHPLDTEGLLEGLEIMTRNIDDTLLIAYLATNSTAGNTLGLKALAHEFSGNYAVEEINDIRRIELSKLLDYNLIDALSTNYVKGKYYPIMVADDQEQIYKELFLPSLKTIIQMELTGMPMNPEKIQSVEADLVAYQQQQHDLVANSPVITMLNTLLQDSAWDKDYEARKAKAKNPGKILPKNRAVFDDLQFNPNSGPQLQRLLYEQMGLPIIDLTDTKQPATGADTIEKLINHTENTEYKELLQALINHGKVSKIISTFLPAFKAGFLKADGYQYLHGSFNLGGTVSGRLSSSDPNMQNLPANSKYGKAVKSIFSAPPGWIFAGADFSSLEDRINTLLTKDPNKIKVYVGHRVYELEINGTTHHIRDDSTIIYDGKTYTAEDFYETYRKI